jgi:hypothetical protein
MTKIAGSRSESESGYISQRHGSPDPDPHQKGHGSGTLRESVRSAVICLLAVVVQVTEQEDDTHILQHLHISRPRPSDGEYNESFQEKLLPSDVP